MSSPGVSPQTQRITRYLARVTLPPLTSIAVAVDYANIALDPDVSLYERYCAASTATRLLAAIRGEEIVEVNKPLQRSGLCERLGEVAGFNVCGKTDHETVKKLVEIVNACERGDVPVTDELVIALAQAVIISLVPQLKVQQREVATGAEEI